MKRITKIHNLDLEIHDSRFTIHEKGFTLVELLVVIALMGILATLVVVSFNRQSAKRSVLLAQNETVTNMRKVQGYSLSARNIEPSVAAKYYIIRFVKDESSYTVSAVDSNYNYYPNVESIKLPQGVVISNLGSGTQSLDCVQIAFAAPYGQTYIYSPSINVYQNENFGGGEIPGGSCTTDIIDILRNPAELLARANQTIEITLSNPKASSAKLVKMYGLSGRIEATDPGSPSLD